MKMHQPLGELPGEVPPPPPPPPLPMWSAFMGENLEGKEAMRGVRRRSSSTTSLSNLKVKPYLTTSTHPDHLDPPRPT